MFINIVIFIFCFLPSFSSWIFATGAVSDKTPVYFGVDCLQKPQYSNLLKEKKIGLITNQTGIDLFFLPTYEVIEKLSKNQGGKLVALFAPEHGLYGADLAEKALDDQIFQGKIPIYSLYGKTLKPTKEMLNGLNLLIFDMQDIGTRSYTYATTLFYAMEAASEAHIPLIVLDRPNPMGGLIVDGPMLEEKWRSFVGYINVPYCHGMTIGELALFFNEEYHVSCDLKVIAMENWRREMSFSKVARHWIPTSPQIPESSTVFYYPMTGLLGQLSLVSIGIGTSLPFKIIGAPWIDAALFSQKLNEQNFSGVKFIPFHFTPNYGKFAKENCSGVLIVITNEQKLRPVAVQYLLFGMLKSLYPKEFAKALNKEKTKIDSFCRACGTAEIFHLFQTKGPIVWPLQKIHKKERHAFLEKRKKYLLPNYL